MEKQVWVLLVIYQKNGAESAACRALREAAYPFVLVVDNSVEEFHNDVYCADAGWEYLPMGGNAGLPKAYNRGIERLRERASAVVLLDDDTTLPEEYFRTLEAARAADPQARIFLPRVTDAVGLLSPCRTTGCGISRVARAEDVPASECTAINSGMAIDMRVFDTYRYDERYFLDFVDHAFMRDMRERGVRFALTDAVLSQRFSGSEEYCAARAKTRFRLFKKDGALYYSTTWKGRAYYPLAVFRRWLSLKRQALRNTGHM